MNTTNVQQTRAECDAAHLEGQPPVDVAAMSLTALADHIEETHHVYLRRELPRLESILDNLATVHGARDPRLHQVADTFATMANELYSHMVKEEQVLFPMVRRIEASEVAPTFHCGSLANPIRQMELEHDDADSALERLRTLTDNFVPPAWTDDTYRAVLNALANLEQDMHLHIHKENDVLFPRALEMEEQKGQTSPV